MDGVFYHGPVSRDHALATYKQADIFISASCYEGLPSSVLEAAAFGLPLILSRIPAHEWLLQQGVGDGLLVDPNNPETCVSQIINYLDNPRIISRSLPKDFRLESVVRKYETIFEGGH
jgi:glycosyltransferase involved in cell wall biosynthesis